MKWQASLYLKTFSLHGRIEVGLTNTCLLENGSSVLPEDGRSGPRSSCSILERISSMREVSVVEVVVVVGLNPGGRNDEMSSWINTPEK